MNFLNKLSCFLCMSLMFSTLFCLPKSNNSLQSKYKSTYKNLKQNFPGYQIKQQNNLFFLSAPHYNGFSADLIFNFKNNNLNYLYSYNVINNSFILTTKDTLRIKNVDSSEIDSISESLIETLYSIRLLNAKNEKFLSLNDNIPTYLIVYDSDGKKLINFSSFKHLLTDLKNKWKGTTVYFRFNEVKKVNNHLEFNAFLISKNNLSEETAEIKAHYNLDYKLDLITIFLYKQKN